MSNILVQVKIHPDDPNVHRIELDLTTVDPFSTLKDEIIMRFQQDVSPPIRYDLFSVDLKEFVLNFGKIQIQSSEEFLGAVTRNSSTGAIMMVATVKRKNGVMDRAQIPKVEDPSSDDDIDSKSTEPEESSEAKTKPKKAKGKTKSKKIKAKKAKAKKATAKKATAKKAKAKKAKRSPVGFLAEATYRTRFLCTLAEMDALNMPAPLLDMLVTYVGFTNKKSENFQKTKMGLQRDGLIESSDKKVSLTTAGLDAKEVKDVKAPEDNAAAHERIKKLLSPKEGQLFEAIKDGSPFPIETVAEAMNCTNVKSAAVADSLSFMTKLGLVKRERKLVQLTAIAFPHGNKLQIQGQRAEV